MNKKEPINSGSLILSLVTLILGIILLFNGNDGVYNIIGYIVSGLLIVSGIIKLLMAYHTNKKYKETDIGGIILSLVLITLGILISVFPKSIMITFSLCVGAVITFTGIQKLILGLAVRKIDQNGSLFFVLESCLIIILGLLILSQKLFNLLGLFLIIYSVSELSGYIYYKSQDKDYSDVLNKKVTKEMRESESKDAIIEEDEN